MKKIWEDTEAALRLANEQMKTYYDRKRGESREYKPKDKVWLEGQNIPTDRPSKKLEDKRYGPFEIKRKVGQAAYELKLPRTWRSIWPVFNEMFLTPYIPSKRPQAPRPPPEIIEGEEEYEVEEIMDSKLLRGKLHYLVKWTGYPERHHWTWEPARNITHAKESIDNFHRKRPSAPRPINSLTTASITYRQLIPISEPITETPIWTNGKVLNDPWTVRIAQLASTL